MTVSTLSTSTAVAVVVLLLASLLGASGLRVPRSQEDAASPSPFSIHEDWSHGWDGNFSAQQMWVDFSGHNHQYLPTEGQIEFVSKHYAMVSLEKCFAQRNFSFTEDAVAWMAQRLKSYNPDTLRVLFYHNSVKVFDQCYGGGEEFRAHKGWWLKDDNGKPYMPQDYNLFDRSAFAFALDSITNVTTHHAQGPSTGDDENGRRSGHTSTSSRLVRMIDGVWLDKGAGNVFSDMSHQREAEFTRLHERLINESRTRMQRRFYPTPHRGGNSSRGSAKLIANGMSFYPSNPEHGLQILDDVDGYCMEHFLAFEMLDAKNGSLIPSLFDKAIRVVHTATRLEKVVLIRGWPGPVSSPIGALGPSWTKAVPSPTPSNYSGRARALSKMLHTSWSAYLILANEWTYFSYNWWYDIDSGVAPCPAGTRYQPKSCSSPRNWFPSLKMKIGAPVGNFTRAGTGEDCRGAPAKSSWIYCREYANVKVQFDAQNVENSYVDPK